MPHRLLNVNLNLDEDYGIVATFWTNFRLQATIYQQLYIGVSCQSQHFHFWNTFIYFFKLIRMLGVNFSQLQVHLLQACKILKPDKSTLPKRKYPSTAGNLAMQVLEKLMDMLFEDVSNHGQVRSTSKLQEENCQSSIEWPS